MHHLVETFKIIVTRIDLMCNAVNIKVLQLKVSGY